VAQGRGIVRGGWGLGRGWGRGRRGGAGSEGLQRGRGGRRERARRRPQEARHPSARSTPGCPPAPGRSLAAPKGLRSRPRRAERAGRATRGVRHANARPAPSAAWRGPRGTQRIVQPLESASRTPACPCGPPTARGGGRIRSAASDAPTSTARRLRRALPRGQPRSTDTACTPRRAPKRRVPIAHLWPARVLGRSSAAVCAVELPGRLSPLRNKAAEAAEVWRPCWRVVSLWVRRGGAHHPQAITEAVTARRRTKDASRPRLARERRTDSRRGGVGGAARRPGAL
jgi:hypothetical protein